MKEPETAFEKFVKKGLERVSSIMEPQQSFADHVDKEMYYKKHNSYDDDEDGDFISPIPNLKKINSINKDLVKSSQPMQRVKSSNAMAPPMSRHYSPNLFQRPFTPYQVSRNLDSVGGTSVNGESKLSEED